MNNVVGDECIASVKVMLWASNVVMRHQL